jgi:hypothetical protein
MTGRLAPLPAATDSPRRQGKQSPSGICTMPTITCLNCNATRQVPEYSPKRPLRCEACGGYWIAIDGLTEKLDNQFIVDMPSGHLAFPIQDVEGTAAAGQGFRMRLRGSVPWERLPDLMAVAQAVGQAALPPAGEPTPPPARSNPPSGAMPATVNADSVIAVIKPIIGVLESGPDEERPWVSAYARALMAARDLAHPADRPCDWPALADGRKAARIAMDRLHDLLGDLHFPAAFRPARRAEKLAILIEIVAALGSPSNVADRKQKARDLWIYRQCCRGKDTPYAKIVAELKRIAPRKDWEVIESIQGIRAAANRHAHLNGKPPIPNRQNL